MRVNESETTLINVYTGLIGHLIATAQKNMHHAVGSFNTRSHDKHDLKNLDPEKLAYHTTMLTRLYRIAHEYINLHLNIRVESQVRPHARRS